MQSEVKEILEGIAKKYDLSFEVVKAICYSQFEATKKYMAVGTPEDFSKYLNIRLKHLGLFYINPYKAKAYNDIIKKHKKEDGE